MSLSEKCIWLTDGVRHPLCMPRMHALNPSPMMNASGEFTPVHVMALARKGTRCCVSTRRERGGEDRACMQ